jgi:hypothetical protein
MRRRATFLAPVHVAILGSSLAGVVDASTSSAQTRSTTESPPDLADAVAGQVPSLVVQAPSATDDAPARTPAIGVVARVPTAIRLKRLAINAEIVELGMDENGAWQLPETGVGWYWFTASPGAVGNAVMVGHFDTWWGGDGPLARLHEARFGDRIDLDVVTRTANRVADGAVTDGPVETLAYAVATSKLVDRTDLSATEATDDERLTLVTCAGWWSFRLNDYTMRRVVTATRTS